MDPCHTALRTASLQNTSRSSRLQMFFKIDALKSFANFTGKHLSSSLFCQGVPYETENWHAWSNEQFFSKRRFFRYLSVCLKRTQIVKIRCIYIVANLFYGLIFFPANNYLLKVTNRNSTIKIETRWRRSDDFIANLEPISHLFLVFLYCWFWACLA